MWKWAGKYDTYLEKKVIIRNWLWVGSDAEFNTKISNSCYKYVQKIKRNYVQEIKEN